MASVTRKISEKLLKLYGYVKRRQEGHVLRRTPIRKGDKRNDRRPDGKICVIDIWKV